MKLYRSVMFVPGNRPEWMDKAPKYKADALVLDLEDAVPNNEKVTTRATVRAGIERLAARGQDVFVRVNGVETGLTGEDVEAIVCPGLLAVMMPKTQYAEEVRKVDAWIELFERKAGMEIGTVKIVVLPETARGIKDSYELATACKRVEQVCGTPHVRSGDIAKAIGYKWTPLGLEVLYAQSHTLLAARSAGFEYPISGGPLEIKNREIIRAQLLRMREVGWRGVLVVHPIQVEVANEVLAPTPDEIEWNKGVLFAMAEAEAAGRAAVTYDGMMVDYAHVRNALDLLHQAEAFGLPVGEYPDIKAL